MDGRPRVAESARVEPPAAPPDAPTRPPAPAPPVPAPPAVVAEEGRVPRGIVRPAPSPFPTRGQPPPGVARRTGRHALPERRGANEHTPPEGYRPRHAVPEAITEQLAVPEQSGSGPGGPLTPAGPPAPLATVTALPTALPTATAPASGPSAVSGAAASATPVAQAAATPEAAAKKPRYDPGPIDPDAPVPDRVRVVLAERRSPTRAVRTVAEIEQQTETGEFLLDNLMRAQLALAVRLGLVAALVLGVLPVFFLVAPALGEVSVAGVGLPWLLLGVAPYPFLLALGWLSTRHAERNERDFAENVED